MADKEDVPEHIRQAVDLVSAILRRIKDRTLDKSQNPCLYIAKSEGVTS